MSLQDDIKMKNLVTILSLFLLNSCNNCKKDDCPGAARFSFRIVDENGKNLLTTPNQKYSIDSLELVRIEGQSISYPPVWLNNDFVSSNVLLNQTQIILNYGNSDADTLDFTNIIENKIDCCGSVTENYDLSSMDSTVCVSCAEQVVVIEK